MERRLVPLFCLIALVVVVTMVWPKAEVAEGGFPPKVHPDGSVEVALINSGPDKVSSTSDDEHWVLRFPAGLDVYTPDPDADGTAPAYSANTIARINFALPNFDFGAGQFDIDPADRLIIALSELVDSVDDPFFAIKLDPTNVPSERQARFENCFWARPIAPGLFALFSKSTNNVGEFVQLTDLLPADRFFLPANCSPRVVRPFENYVIIGAEGAPFGHGHCPIEEAVEALNTCQFDIWLPMQRAARVSFKPNYIEETPVIAQFIRKFVVDVTDFEASQNIKLEDQHLQGTTL